MTESEYDWTSLAGAETFDPALFVGDEQVSQALCNLVLALALVFNDMKDALHLHIVFNKSQPAILERNTPTYGAFHGINHHIFRLAVGIFRELFRLLAESRPALSDPFLAKVVKGMPREAREGWTTLLEVAQGATHRDELGRSLSFIRDKIAFHYDPKCLFRGFSLHFLDPRLCDARAYVSRGANMAESRFYFADAASTSYARNAAGGEEAEELASSLSTLLRPVNVSIMKLIEGFIQARGGAFRGT